jgi:hypothetical protein
MHLCSPKILCYSQGHPGECQLHFTTWGHGSLTDTKRIIRQYTEESESLAPVIDNLTLQREFIIFDLQRSKTDPLLIRV